MRAHEADAVMHFAAWLSVGESVKDPVGYYENNVGGALVGAAGDGRDRRPRTSSSRPPPPPSATRSRRRSPKTIRSAPINAYGETKLAIERALPHFERAYGLRWMALRYFNAAGADPDGALGEDHHPEIHVIPRAIDAALGRDTFAIYGDDYDTPDGTCLRDYVHVTDLASAHLLALAGALRAAGRPRHTISATAGRSRSARWSTPVERVTGRHGAGQDRPAAARRSRRAVRVERQDPARARLGAAVRGHRRDRRDGVALARSAPARLRQGRRLLMPRSPGSAHSGRSGHHRHGRDSRGVCVEGPR